MFHDLNVFDDLVDDKFDVVDLLDLFDLAIRLATRWFTPILFTRSLPRVGPLLTLASWVLWQPGRLV